jgi:hypothetical protein
MTDGPKGWSGIEAWATLRPQALADLVRLEAAADTSGSGGRGGIYVKWSGLLRGPGQYGHMSVSKYEMIVERVTFVGAGDGGVCERPGPFKPDKRQHNEQM